MRKPRNTETEMKTELGALSFLAASMGRGGPSQAIEEQERGGQASFVGSDTLPTDIMGDRATLEAAGVQFLGPVEGDQLFQYVKLPAGWKKQPTEHAMWSSLVDDKGVERAAIFYKAAFYDRKAHMSITAAQP